VLFKKVGKADCTFVMLDADFMKMVDGKLNPKTAFMTGKVKIRGNMAKAMKFNPSVLPQDAKL
jgi:putative sterol carrier protein